MVLSGTGKLFTTGIDLGDLTQMAGIVMSDDDVARKCRALRKIISSYQESFTAIEKVNIFFLCIISLEMMHLFSKVSKYCIHTVFSFNRFKFLIDYVLHFINDK